MSSIGALLAAGLSRRFGPEDKLLAPWRGQPLVRHAAEALRGAGCAELIAVVSQPEVAAQLPGFTLLWVAPGLPMSQSFSAVLSHAQRRGAGGLLLTLGDMPQVDGALLRRLLALPGSAACIADGRRMPPAHLVAADFADALALPPGDHGARAVIAAIPPERLVAIDRATARDIDLPGDLPSDMTGP